ncbi:uncharacterized protein LOC105202166 [Solenopsis invicta]|uniref:uncharacterized protein LOC105202166 n=1 Tax=Solenopsis invicta TaxID=13686 RepID=UPI00193CD408|nr:uncharacterized protein LOC105202166 [Solenopsis invicta]
MKKMEMGILIFLIFVTQALLIVGKVILIHNILNHEMTLICMSEYDGGALVWNYRTSIVDYYGMNGLQKSDIMCKMNENRGCLESWTKQDWNLTDSLLTPMGPVFDQRWEKFRQFNVHDWMPKILTTNFNEVKLSFSVRTTDSIVILICKRDFCYWIIINSWNYTQPTIGKCPIRTSTAVCFSQLSQKLIQNSASEFKWQTFVITWNFDMGKIILYDTDKIIYSYTNFLTKKIQLNSSSDNNYYMLAASSGKGSIRLHTYKFLHTTVENATLTSPIFQIYDKVICVQLLVGLCVECDAQIILRDSTNDAVLVMAIIKGSTKAAVHGLPMWQSVTIKDNLINHSNNRVIIQLIPKLNNHNINPLWAIANVRQCPPNGTLRKNVISFHHKSIERPNVTCQKLFYNEHAIVSSKSSIKSDVNLDASYCPLGKIGPKCLVSCKYDLHNNFNCKGIQICYEDGCTCDAGFSGAHCFDSCDSNTYDYNCRKTCGSCLYNETLSNNRCDTRTGICSNGCNNTNTEFYIPPLCQTSIEKPNAPTIISINETAIWIIVNITWKDEYEEIPIYYSFVIQEHIKYNQQSWNKLFRNMTQVTKHFENVEPGFTYHIRLSLNISGVQIHSDWKVVETKCNPAENFDITSEENGMIIEQINSNQLYSCPARWYYLVIYNKDTNEEDVSTLVPSFPYEFKHLSAYTSFNVTISHKNRVLFSKSISVNNVSPTLYEAWKVPITTITSIFVVIVIASYLYRRKKQQWNEEQIRNEIALSQESVNCEHETTFRISNRIEFMGGLSHIYESISSLQASTPEALVTATTHSEEEEAEMVSLVKVKDFEKYVRQAIQSGLLDKQYKAIKKVMKNYTDDAYPDYINANYITGYQKEKRYIAMQGPEPNTVTDFWRMIWQENVLIICMLTNVVENEKTKCEQYWPHIDKKMKYGDITVLNKKQNIFADYSFRTFQVTYREETRKIEHLHYTAWPDYEVPLNTHSVVTYLKKLLSLSPGDGPMVVHYSGVEKTGIIILCDICLRRAAADGKVDVLAETISIRSERNNMINNKQQYLYAHLVLVECWFSISTPCNKMLITRIKKLKEQSLAVQQRLQDTAWQDEILGQDKVSRVYLKKYPISDGQSDYLPAVYVDGVKLQNQYLATQLPIQSTFETFWRMIAEYKVELIVMLQPPDPTCCEIAPTSGEFEPTPYLHITVKEVVKEKCYTSQKLLLVDNFEKPKRKQYVTITCLTEWKPGQDQPLPSVRSMVTFWQAAESIARSNGPTVTLCHDGVTGCGLYLALSFLLERMTVEKECDVYLAVRAVKRSRTDFVRSMEHLEYLYDAAVTYMEFFQNYANFL